jgi:hypothetical protein
MPTPLPEVGPGAAAVVEAVEGAEVVEAAA